MRSLVVIGGGFAGVRAAQAAAASARAAGVPLQVTLASESERLTLRPRLYLAEPDSWEVSLRPALEPLGIRLLVARVDGVDVAGRWISLEPGDGLPSALRYDAAVIASGSRLRWPAVPGLAEAAFDVDTAKGAALLLRHISALAPAESTFSVVGAGFTGLEIATGLRETLTRLHGSMWADRARILLVDGSNAAPNLGSQAGPVLREALSSARIETRFGLRVVSASPGELTFEGGERMRAGTIIYAGGMEARTLPLSPALPTDELGRLHTDAFLGVPQAEGLFAAGDAARAAVDETGRLALMSCQHAIAMGDRAGRNAAAQLLGLPLSPYRQPSYVTCLDLGSAGALFTVGWDRQLVATGHSAKLIKRSINAMIAPPAGSLEAILRTLQESTTAAENLPGILSRQGTGSAAALALS